jgi:large subunit ribosomal protein L9
MKIILLKDVKKIGRKYEIKEVADGYALNMLIPAKMAVSATLGNVNIIESLKKGDLLENAKSEAETQKALNEIKDIILEIKGKVSDKGHLFAGVHKEQIIAELKKQKGINIIANHLDLNHPIKEVGEHAIKVKVGDREASFKLIISQE